MLFSLIRLLSEQPDVQYTCCSKHFKERTRGGILPLEFLQTHTITLKKTRFGGGTRQISFHVAGVSQRAELKPNGKVLHVTIGQGLPNTTSERRTKSISERIQVFFLA